MQESTESSICQKTQSLSNSVLVNTKRRWLHLYIANATCSSNINSRPSPSTQSQHHSLYPNLIAASRNWQPPPARSPPPPLQRAKSTDSSNSNHDYAESAIFCALRLSVGSRSFRTVVALGTLDFVPNVVPKSGQMQWATKLGSGGRCVFRWHPCARHTHTTFWHKSWPSHP